jgi:hypothetical protein
METDSIGIPHDSHITKCFTIETGYVVWRKVRRSFSGVDYSGYNRPQYFLISLDTAIKVFSE